MQSVGNKMASGAAWMVLFKLTERSLGVVSTLILARLLVPADFGLVAMATSFVALLELMSAFGFDIALISRRDSDVAHYNTAWTFNVIFSSGIAVLMLLLAWPMAQFMNEPRLALVVCVLAIGSLAIGFENIGVVAFRKDMQFAREFRYQIAKKFAMFMVTVPLAFLLRNHWALVCGVVTGRLASVLISYRVHPFRPSFTLSARHDLFHFSKWLLVNSVLGFLKERLSNFIIGRLAGARALGVYTVGYEIANLPTTELVAPISRAVLPGYAKLADDRGALQKALVQVVGLTALFATAAGIGIAVTAPALVPLALGAQWLDAIPVIQIIAVFGAIASLQSSSYVAFLALGEPRLTAMVDALYVVLMIVLMIVLVAARGVLGAAIACLLTAIVIVPVNYAVLLRKLGLPVSRLLAVLWRPPLAAAIMAFAVHEFLALTSASGVAVELLRLLAAVGIGVLVYLASVSLLWLVSGRPEGAESAVLDRVRDWLRARRA